MSFFTSPFSLLQYSLCLKTLFLQTQVIKSSATFSNKIRKIAFNTKAADHNGSATEASFHRFSDLPAELRIMIRKFALPDRSDFSAAFAGLPRRKHYNISTTIEVQISLRRCMQI